MPLPVGVAFDMNRVADDPLDRMAAAVDAWRHRLDDETRRRYSLRRRNGSFARADDRGATAFENAQLSRPQRQYVVRREIGSRAQRVFERQEFADFARNGRGRQGKVAIHSRIGEDDPDTRLVARAPDCRQNFACARGPEREPRQSGLNNPLWLAMNAFAAAMSSLRSKGRSAASSNQLFAAPTGWARRPSRPYSKPIGTRIPSPSAADAHSRNFDRFWTVAWSQSWNFRLPESGSSNEIMISPKTREASANRASRPASKRWSAGKKAPAKPAPANFGTASSSGQTRPERNDRIGRFALAIASREDGKNPFRRVRSRATAKAGDPEFFELEQPSSERVDPATGLRFIGERDRQVLPFGGRDSRIARSHAALGKAQHPSRRTRRGHGRNRNIEDDLQRPVVRQRDEFSKVEVRGDSVGKNVPTREGEKQRVEAEPRLRLRERNSTRLSF